jgi:hypothetical protein
MATPDTTRMTIDIPIEEHRKLKAIAALRGVSMKVIILECLSRELYSDNVPNELTEKTLEDSDNDKNVKYYADLNELRERLGL